MKKRDAVRRLPQARIADAPGGYPALHARDRLLGEPARNRQQAALLPLDAALLVGPAAALAEAFDLAQLRLAAQPPRGRQRELDQLLRGHAGRPHLVAVEVDQLRVKP